MFPEDFGYAYLRTKFKRVNVVTSRIRDPFVFKYFKDEKYSLFATKFVENVDRLKYRVDSVHEHRHPIGASPVRPGKLGSWRKTMDWTQCLLALLSPGTGARFPFRSWA